jgi:hypothetical protein
LELVRLPEKLVEIGDGGKIGGWSADALRRNLEAVRSNRVFIQRIDGENNGVDMEDITYQGGNCARRSGRRGGEDSRRGRRNSTEWT